MMKDGKREREREMGREAMLVRKYEYMNNMNKHETLTSVIGRVRNGDIGSSFGQISASARVKEYADESNLAVAVAEVVSSDTALKHVQVQE